MLYKVTYVQWSMFRPHHRQSVLVNVDLEIGFYIPSLLLFFSYIYIYIFSFLFLFNYLLIIVTLEILIIINV